MNCKICGEELLDNCTKCSKCGCLVQDIKNETDTQEEISTIKKVAKVFIIIGCILTGIYGFLIPFAWTIPMTVSYCKKIKSNQPISVGFKVCILIFVSTISGILLLCDNKK